ncbi:chemotaxis protein CheB [Chitinophaga horti]|uniref:protein-glutamate methylesterase n=1 Tax=Chitinophaga horti TaxID=2920382 RepID=A0ABY6J660_9BACT|nr:chemotaxis protein CheB [Chitinophaga horti]UYQ94990.1 chemotaxis protein CheB [Chitinophaga horti]
MINESDFYVIAIGCSAGGLEPLVEIISQLPKDLPAAIIVMHHILRNVESNLAHILERRADIKVVAVETTEYLEPGTVYVPAYGHQLKVRDRLVMIEERSPEDIVNHSIDVLFHSLAEHAKEKSIGIILSGSGTDGLSGAYAIEKAGGIVIVQDPETAAFPRMPHTLIANDHPDYVLKPGDIRRKIVEKVREPGSSS